MTNAQLVGSRSYGDSNWRIKALGLVGGLLLLPNGLAQSPEAAEVERRLRTIVEQIETIETRLRSGERERGEVGAELARIERQIGSAGKKLHVIDGQIELQQQELARLELAQAELRKALGRQSSALAAQIRSAFILGRQHRLKLLLNLEDLNTASRTLRYYKYFNEARESLIGVFAEEIAQAQALRQQIASTRDEMTAARAELLAQQDQQRAFYQERQRFLENLINELGQRLDELSQLNADQSQLAELLEQLRDIFHDIPDALDLEAPAFPTLRGKLRWPIAGRLIESPGREKSGGLHRNGAVLQANAGTDVKAIAHGRVAFADWLRGFGLLIIIDHGNDYLSLYGFNEALYRDTGDWVTPGESIAAVGNSGGRSNDGLYFELRRGAEAIDPRRWLTDSAQR